MNYEQTMSALNALASEKNRKGMSRFGINVQSALGISVVEIRKIARGIRIDDELAMQLWASGIHEARLLACLVADPARFDARRMDSWVGEFDSWDTVDLFSMAVFYKLPDISHHVHAWAECEMEFVRRTAFATIAAIAFKHKTLPNLDFEPYFALMLRHCGDSRNFVKKAVNWALRQVGKRNIALNKRAMLIAAEIHATGTSSARWIARDAIRELESDAVQTRLAAREKAHRALPAHL